jgi:hypothetical protein
MKKKTGKKTTKPKAPASGSSGIPKKAIKTPRGRGDGKASSKLQNVDVAGTTPFQSSAASPLSKELGATSEVAQKAEPHFPKAEAASKGSESIKTVPPDSPVPPQQGRETKATASLKFGRAKPGKRPSRGTGGPKVEVKIPPVLLEGDISPNPGLSGPGARYALAPVPVTHAIVGSGELPESYGTQRIFLAARDPHWLYVSWDFTSEHQRRLNAESRDGHLVLRVFSGEAENSVVPDVHVHPESKNWFVHVPYSETVYRVEIGFHTDAGKWRTAAVSQATVTPPEGPSNDISATFATIPAEVTFQQVVEAVQQFVAISTKDSLLDAVAQASDAQRQDLAPPARTIREPKLPRTSKTRIGQADSNSRKTRSQKNLPVQITEGSQWSEEQTRLLTKLIHIDGFRRVWLGSMEITELVRMQLQEELASMASAESGRKFRDEKRPSPELNESSPQGGAFSKPGKFWFKLNAELILYGATEPDATVTIGDRPIKLRPDGTFSFRFSLPDGRYQLPAIAISKDREELREARLEFSRSTEYQGQVMAHPQEPGLSAPSKENVS